MKTFKLWCALLFSCAAIIPGSAPAQVTPLEIKLSASDTRQLNIFFSNFSEVFMPAFHMNGITDREMIAFGVAHNYRNSPKLFEKLPGGDKTRIKQSYVSEAALKYLGRKITKHQSVNDYEYQNGYYTVVEACGEMFQFSQVARVIDLGNKRYTVDVNVYSASSGWTGNTHGTPASWTKTGDDAPELSQKMKATIAKQTRADGKTSYVLLEYLNN